MIRGRCLWWDDEQGFGVIVSDGAPGEVWTSFAHVKMPGFRKLSEGQIVDFEWEEPTGGQNGYRYRAVRVVPRT